MKKTTKQAPKTPEDTQSPQAKRRNSIVTIKRFLFGSRKRSLASLTVLLVFIILVVAALIQANAPKPMSAYNLSAQHPGLWAEIQPEKTSVSDLDNVSKFVLSPSKNSLAVISDFYQHNTDFSELIGHDPSDAFREAGFTTSGQAQSVKIGKATAYQQAITDFSCDDLVYHGTAIAVFSGDSAQCLLLLSTNTASDPEKEELESIKQSLSYKGGDITVTFKDGDKTLATRTGASNTGFAQYSTKAIEPQRKGYVLAGWDAISGSTSSTYDPDAKTVSGVQSSTIFNARWEKGVTVTFTDGSGKTLSTETIKSGDAVTAPDNPTRDGYFFKGWNQDLKSVTKDMTVDAQWEKACKVVFTDGRGKTLKTETVKSGEAASAPAQPTADDATFIKWDKTFDKVVGDITVNAVWKPNPTISQQNALDKAHDYLNYSPFSYKGLVEQLEFEGFSHEDATYAADYCGADWNWQAALKAQDYLDYSSFSRNGLINQLEFEGFTREQAIYGVDQTGLK